MGIFKHCKIETIPTALVYCDGQVVASAPGKASTYKKFEDALVLAERRLSTGYFPVNSCEVYSCKSDDPELTHLSCGACERAAAPRRGAARHSVASIGSRMG